MRVIILCVGTLLAVGFFTSCSLDLNPNYRSPQKCDPADYEALLGTAYVPGLSDAFPPNRGVVVPGGRLRQPDGRDDFPRFYLGEDFSTILKIDCAKSRAAVQLPDREIPENGGRFGPQYVFGEGFVTE